MKDASNIAYQAFFFDNSLDYEPLKLTAHFKMQSPILLASSIVATLYKHLCG